MREVTLYRSRNVYAEKASDFTIADMCCAAVWWGEGAWSHEQSSPVVYAMCRYRGAVGLRLSAQDHLSSGVSPEFRLTPCS